MKLFFFQENQKIVNLLYRKSNLFNIAEISFVIFRRYGRTKKMIIGQTVDFILDWYQLRFKMQVWVNLCITLANLLSPVYLSIFRHILSFSDCLRGLDYLSVRHSFCMIFSGEKALSSFGSLQNNSFFLPVPIITSASQPLFLGVKRVVSVCVWLTSPLSETLVNEVGGTNINELVTESEGPNTLTLNCHATLWEGFHITCLYSCAV